MKDWLIWQVNTHNNFSVVVTSTLLHILLMLNSYNKFFGLELLLIDLLVLP